MEMLLQIAVDRYDKT